MLLSPAAALKFRSVPCFFCRRFASRPPLTSQLVLLTLGSRAGQLRRWNPFSSSAPVTDLFYRHAVVHNTNLCNVITEGAQPEKTGAAAKQTSNRNVRRPRAGLPTHAKQSQANNSAARGVVPAVACDFPIPPQTFFAFWLLALRTISARRAASRRSSFRQAGN
jgi:hypothetical protein